MDDELILPEADAPILPAADSPDPSSSRPRKTILLGTIIAIVFIALATALVIIITGKSSIPSPDDSSETSDSSSPTFYYDSDEFTAAMERAYESLHDFSDYEAAEYYLQPYSAIERMSAPQKYRFFSFYAEMYSEKYLNRPELAQKYTALADNTLKSIREGAS